MSLDSMPKTKNKVEESILQFDLLKGLLNLRMDYYFNVVENSNHNFNLEYKKLSDTSYYIDDKKISKDEYFTVLLALVPHISANLLDITVQQFLPNGGEFPEFGGVKSGNHRGMVPTGETAVFLLAGSDFEKRKEVQRLFYHDHFFYKEKILWLEDVKEGEPRMSGRIILSQEWLDKLLYGEPSKPKFGPNFPAKLVETKMNWQDVILHPQTREGLNLISLWVEKNEELSKDKNLCDKLKPGYRVLFHGPSGTGKTLTAALLGKEFKKDVYRIDLSQVVSKYIGETEQNLEKIFTKAENKGWILFFDEADALFGKRTGVQSSNDRYANQEVSYLLQRVEDFPNLIILASNLKNNVDKAFLRRFNQVVHFPLPDANERMLLWENSIPTSAVKKSEEVNIEHLARKYEISGASIMNIVQTASLLALGRGDDIRMADIEAGGLIELQKQK